MNSKKFTMFKTEEEKREKEDNVAKELVSRSIKLPENWTKDKFNEVTGEEKFEALMKLEAPHEGIGEQLMQLTRVKRRWSQTEIEMRKLIQALMSFLGIMELIKKEVRRSSTVDLMAILSRLIIRHYEEIVEYRAEGWNPQTYQHNEFLTKLYALIYSGLTDRQMIATESRGIKLPIFHYGEGGSLGIIWKRIERKKPAFGRSYEYGIQLVFRNPSHIGKAFDIRQYHPFVMTNLDTGVTLRSTRSMYRMGCSSGNDLTSYSDLLEKAKRRWKLLIAMGHETSEEMIEFKDDVLDLMECYRAATMIGARRRRIKKSERTWWKYWRPCRELLMGSIEPLSDRHRWALMAARFRGYEAELRGNSLRLIFGESSIQNLEWEEEDDICTIFNVK